VVGEFRNKPSGRRDCKPHKFGTPPTGPQHHPSRETIRTAQRAGILPVGEDCGKPNPANLAERSVIRLRSTSATCEHDGGECCRFRLLNGVAVVLRQGSALSGTIGRRNQGGDGQKAASMR